MNPLVVAGLATVLLFPVNGHPQERAAGATGDSPSAEQVVRKFWDVFNRAAWDELDPLVSPAYSHHPPGQSLTLAQFKEGGAWVHRGLANYHLQIDSLIVSGDLVAVRWTARGTHTGSFFGETPTRREIVVQGMHFHRLAGGRIAEDWETIDFDGFKRQLRNP